MNASSTGASYAVHRGETIAADEIRGAFWRDVLKRRSSTSQGPEIRMITLHLLGGARLEGEDGRLGGEAVQRHRLGLLALLALARDRRLPREKLLAYLWPEHGPRRARHLLNVAVHVLRKAVGKHAIRSEGDDLRLDLDHLRCDVVAFEEAVERGDVRAATELYAGPFMDGYFLDGAPEFDQWQEMRRRELEDAFLAALAAGANAAEAAGDAAEAVRCLRALVRRRPIDAAATIRLMEALAAAGDRAGALKAAERHTRALAEAFDAMPSPEVEQLARRIREAPAPPPGTARSRGAPGVEEGPHVAAHSDGAPPGAAGGTSSRAAPGAEAAAAAARAAETAHSGGTPSVAAEAAPSRATTPAAAAAAEAATSGAMPAATKAPAGRNARPAPRAPRRRMLGLSLVAASAVATLLLALRADDRGAAAEPLQPSVAVLPFADMSPNGDQAYFSDGLTEELLNALAQTPGLRVAARSSSFLFRGPGVDVRSVGRRLDVGAVVEGSVRVDGGQLRVTVQLIDAESGYHLWSGQYDREMRHIFAVQEEIARAVATQLSAELALQLPDTLLTTTTANPAAYRLYLRGRHEWRKRTEEGMWAALEAFEQAIVLDPTYAGAYAGLADTWQLLPDYGGVESSEGLARAKTAALRAVALDSTLAEAHVALGALLDDYDHDRQGAEAAYRRAIALNPGYATARHWLGLHLANGGRFEEALVQIEQARRLDPLSDIVNTAVGAVRYFARDYEGAMAEYRAVLQLRPDFALGWALLGRVQLVAGQVDDAVASLERSVTLSDGDPSYRAVYAAALAARGRTEEARAIAQSVESPSDGGYVPYCELAAAYLYLDENDHALALFRRGYEERDSALKHIGVEPLYDRIRSHPAFAELMREAGLDVDMLAHSHR
jgi:serine/threonine-protein kinase